MLLYCVRHGESTYNAEGRVQGQCDVPLSDLGIRQGCAVAAALGEMPIDAIYSSPLQRAYRTAQFVAEELELEILTDDRLKELNAGVFQGKLRSELGELYAEEYARWTSGDPEFTIPGGESRNDLRQRGTDVLQWISTQDHEHVAVIGHGRLMITALKEWLEMPLESEPRSLRNGSITRLEVNGSGRVRLMGIDEVGHLAHLGDSGCGDL